MIYFICQIESVWTINGIIQEMPTSLSERITTLTYEELIDCQLLPHGSYVFCGLEIQSPAQLEFNVQIWETLSRESSAIGLLNNPLKVLHRYELLERLEAKGINDFRAFRASDSVPDDLAFPVIVREERNHSGILADLVHDRQELKSVLRKAVYLNGYDRKKLLIVEYCHTADETGVFRTYAAFKIGDRIVPMRISFGRHWDVGYDPAKVYGDAIEGEYEYVLKNPHESRIREIFQIAQIDYGRIDYGMVNGNIRCWEINTAPAFAVYLAKQSDPEIEHIRQMRLRAHHIFKERFFAAVSSLDVETDRNSSISIVLDQRLRTTLQKERKRKQRMLKFSRYFLSVGSRLPDNRGGQLLRIVFGRPAWWFFNRFRPKR